MQAFFESIFDVGYLFVVLLLGWTMAKNSPKGSVWRDYGIMAIVLGCGDAFHLFPRIFALWSGDMAGHAASLGFGKLVTSITMTVFYVLLYRFWRRRYHPEESGVCIRCVVVYGLAIVRVLLCLFPQNDWFSLDAPLSWGILRNIPFAILGACLIWFFYQSAARGRDAAFEKMWLAITLSFAFYFPVVLFADLLPPIGMLMIPKTIAYVWIVWMGFRAYSSEKPSRPTRVR